MINAASIFSEIHDRWDERANTFGKSALFNREKMIDIEQDMYEFLQYSITLNTIQCETEIVKRFRYT